MLWTRLIALVSLIGGALLVVGAGDAFAASSKVTKTCAAVADFEDDLQDLDPTFGGRGGFDGGVYTKLGNAFAKAAKTAPKNMKASLKTISDYYKEIGEADGVVEAGIAASENAGEFAEASAKFFGKFYSKQCLGVTGSSSSGTSSGSGAGSGRGGTLELGDETIALDSARCYLQEQTVGRSTIELTAQATGTNADGETVILDFSRYAEGDQFEGDDINIDVGDPTAADFYQYIGSLDYGEVDVSGSSLSRSGFDVRHSETNESVPASFQIEC